jgi:prepilin-type N-terminal cleavage/methylation domain-containing protein
MKLNKASLLPNIANDKKGMSLVEIMVVVVIMSLVGLGTTTLFKNIIETQRKNTVKSSMSQVRDNLKRNIQNDQAWVNTVNAYPISSSSLGCLRDNIIQTAWCSHETSIDNFNVRDTQNNMFYQASQATRGFTADGQDCNSFNSGAGNDACPYRYNLNIVLRCPDGNSQCRKPQMTIEATFVVRPNTRGGLLERIDVEEYNFRIERTERIKFEPLTFVHRVSGGGPANGGGTCSGEARRQLNQRVNDVGENGELLSLNRFRLQPGFYDCTITAQVYSQPGGYSISLRDTAGTIYPVGNGYTTIDGSNIVSGKVQFRIETPTVFFVHQLCPAPIPPVQSHAVNPWARGIPTPGYTPEDLTSVTCVKSS